MLEPVREAYPGAMIWQQAAGMWLRTESTVLPGLGKKATFLTAIPYEPRYVQKSWGFWTTPLSCTWIGPRHTNYPDGSVCAFEPRDATWVPGDSLIKLIDLYTVWAARHEHLNVFGKWPGHQSVPLAFERLTEFHGNEFCGCDRQEHRYDDCCKTRDRTSAISSFARLYCGLGGNIARVPPQAIDEFARRSGSPPDIAELLTARQVS